MLALGSPTHGQEPCCPRLTWKDLAEHSEIWLENPYDVMTALSFKFTTLTNVRPDLAGPFLIQVKPHERVMLTRLFPIDRGQRYAYDFRYHWMWGDLHATHDPSTPYQLPYAPGTSHKVLQGFNGAFTHKGELAYAVDFDLAPGTPVHAARAGTVVLTEDRFSRGGVDPAFFLTANYVMVRHDDGTIGTYEHLRQGGVSVRVGQKVAAGDLLGYSGSTGYSAMPHLHFMVYRALDGWQRESFPMRFIVQGQPQPVLPLEGKTYTRP